MGITNAGALLKNYSLKKAMHEDGVTHPSEYGRNLIRLLVEKLSQLDSSEEIDIVTAENGGLPAKFVRVATGEVLAEVQEQG
jgi:hypothetical protein